MNNTDERRYTFQAQVVRNQSGFTLIELLVVIAIIAVLASMVLGSLSVAKSTAYCIVCKSNLKSLQAGWFMYAHDHNDTMPPNKLGSWNFDTVCVEGYYDALGSWALGNAKMDALVSNIRGGVLFPYSSALGVYHCPADKSKVDEQPDVPRIRSYSLAYFMNGDKYLSDQSGNGEPFPLVKERTQELHNPAGLFVFLDESEQTIEGGSFFLHYPGDVGEREAGPHWMNVPTDRHSQGCDLSFADGHVARQSWRSPKKNDVSGTTVPESDPRTLRDFQDLRTLQSHMPTPLLPPR